MMNKAVVVQLVNTVRAYGGTTDSSDDACRLGERSLRITGPNDLQLWRSKWQTLWS